MYNRDEIIDIDEFRTFVPSYDQPAHPSYIEPPSRGQLLVESFVTAAVWTGVLGSGSTFFCMTG